MADETNEVERLTAERDEALERETDALNVLMTRDGQLTALREQVVQLTAERDEWKRKTNAALRDGDLLNELCGERIRERDVALERVVQLTEALRAVRQHLAENPFKLHQTAGEAIWAIDRVLADHAVISQEGE